VATHSQSKRLTLAEWAVLGLVGCEPQHAFALVKSLAPAGELGRVWSVPTPVVYRAVNRLREHGLINAIGEERSDAGPPRTTLGITQEGKRRLDAWLRTPVSHLREVRNELMLKLALLSRMRKSSTKLVDSQLRAFAPLLRALEERAGKSGCSDFEITLARWRLENGRAVVRFLEDLVDPPRASRASAP